MTRAPLTLPALLLLFASPIAAAWLFYAHPQWVPAGRLNHGELIQPVVPVGDLRADRFGNVPLQLGQLRGRWLLLLTAERCEGECLSALWNMRQVRLALGEKRAQVERLLLVRHTPSNGLREMFRREYPGLEVGSLSGPLAAQLPAAEDGALFIVDPLGNAMMRYGSGASGKDLLTDLERLLKSQGNWGKYAGR